MGTINVNILNDIFKEIWYKCTCDLEFSSINDIVFNPKFMDKYMDKVECPDWAMMFYTILIEQHLDNPLDYLYKALFL